MFRAVIEESETSISRRSQQVNISETTTGCISPKAIKLNKCIKKKIKTQCCFFARKHTNCNKTHFEIGRDLIILTEMVVFMTSKVHESLGKSLHLQRETMFGVHYG